MPSLAMALAMLSKQQKGRNNILNSTEAAEIAQASIRPASTRHRGSRSDQASHGVRAELQRSAAAPIFTNSTILATLPSYLTHPHAASNDNDRERDRSFEVGWGEIGARRLKCCSRTSNSGDNYYEVARKMSKISTQETLHRIVIVGTRFW